MKRFYFLLLLLTIGGGAYSQKTTHALPDDEWNWDSHTRAIAFRTPNSMFIKTWIKTDSLEFLTLCEDNTYKLIMADIVDTGEIPFATIITGKWIHNNYNLELDVSDVLIDYEEKEFDGFSSSKKKKIVKLIEKKQKEMRALLLGKTISYPLLRIDNFHLIVGETGRTKYFQSLDWEADAVERIKNTKSYEVILREQRLEEERRLEDEEINNFRDFVNTIGTSPTFYGYKLIKTNTIDGLKCEHYEKGNDKIRVFYNSIGDYVTVPEDIDGFDVAPDEINICGAYKFHLEKGGSRESLGCPNGSQFVGKYTFKNGNVLLKKINRDVNYYPNYPWDPFKKGGYLKGSTVDLLENDYDFSYKILKTKYELLYGYILASKPNDLFISKYFKSTNRCKWNCNGIKIGNYIYSVTRDGSLCVVSQEFEGDYIPCVASDTIIGFSYSDPRYEKKYEILYKNGDWFKQEDGHSSGLLHRGKTVISLDTKNSGEWARMKYSDNSVFAGAIKFNDNVVMFFCDDQPMDLIMENWYPLRGKLRYPDGRSVAYVQGEPEAERNERIQAAENKKNAEDQAIYDALCKKYGKKYVDAMANQQLIVGMPEYLLVKGFKTKLIEQKGNTKLYKVYGWGVRNTSRRMTVSDHLYYGAALVKNGKIDHVELK